jgi:error-prone DNA polymerase
MQRARGRMSRDIIPVEVREIIRRERDALGLTWAEIGRRTGLSVREIQSRGKHKKGFRRFVIDRLAACLRSRELARLAGSDLYWDRVVVIEPAGRRESYDLRIQGNHNFLANNLVVHNSHSASFALLVYVSSWIKRHEPAAFLAALLNSQPMGFYAPSQLVQDARRHGVQVLPVDVTASSWDCVLEKNEELNRRDAEKNQDKMNRQDAKRNENQNGPEGNDSSSLIPHPSSLAASAPAVRLGLRMISGFAERAAGRIVTARNEHAFGSVEDLARRARLNRHDLKLLASAGALRSLSDHRRLAHWEVAGIERATPVLGDYPIDESLPQLAPPGEAEELVADYASLGLTLGRHPLALLRPRLARMRLATAAELRGYAHGRPARAAGIVVGRQRPDTASGVIFVTLEDETGSVNVIVWRDLADRQRRELLGSRLMEVYGTLEREGEVVHLIAQRLVDHSQLLGALETSSRDFH